MILLAPREQTERHSSKHIEAEKNYEMQIINANEPAIKTACKRMGITERELQSVGSRAGQRPTSIRPTTGRRKGANLAGDDAKNSTATTITQENRNQVTCMQRE
jgi:hypothetical protein